MKLPKIRPPAQFVLATAMLLMAGCDVTSSTSSNATSQATPQPPQEIHGQVFIALQGGGNLTLGDVQVSFFTVPDINSWLAQSLEANKDDVKTLNDDISESDRIRNQLYDVIGKDDAEETRLQARLDAINEQLEPLVPKLNALGGGNQPLPSPLATATTDANGNFRTTIPSNEPVIAFARYSRGDEDGVKRYLWIVKVPPSDFSNVILSNSNWSMNNFVYSGKQF